MAQSLFYHVYLLIGFCSCTLIITVTPYNFQKLSDVVNRHNTEDFLDLFTNDAIVDDWGKRYVGRDQIRRWCDSEFIGTGGYLRILRVISDTQFAHRFTSRVDDYVGTMSFVYEGRLIKEMSIRSKKVNRASSTKMTITYSDKVYLFLLRWKGSVWKTVWKQLAVWLILWYVVYFVLTFALTAKQKTKATQVVAIFKGFCENLPLVFILGFYVGQVVTRWWNIVMVIPWPDDSVAVANSYLFGGDQVKAIRESVARWLVLCEAMVFRQVSPRIHKRFPQLDHLVDAGLMTKQELLIIRKTKCKNTRWQMPLDWIVDKIIFPSEVDPIVKVAFCNSVNAFRNGMRQLFTYDWIGIPLVYTQTVAIVVYGYFLLALVGHQYAGKDIDLYVPWLSILQFIFYVGWLNVARDLMHPFGEDDDDIELNCILDRHAAVAISLATEVREESPDIVFDPRLRKEMSNKMSNNLTYSVAANKIANHPPKNRAFVDVADQNDQSQVEKLNQDFIAEQSGCAIIKENTPLNFF